MFFHTLILYTKPISQKTKSKRMGVIAKVTKINAVNRKIITVLLALFTIFSMFGQYSEFVYVYANETEFEEMSELAMEEPSEPSTEEQIEPATEEPDEQTQEEPTPEESSEPTTDEPEEADAEVCENCDEAGCSGECAEIPAPDIKDNLKIEVTAPGNLIVDVEVKGNGRTFHAAMTGTSQRTYIEVENAENFTAKTYIPYGYTANSAYIADEGTYIIKITVERAPQKPYYSDFDVIGTGGNF